LATWNPRPFTLEIDGENYSATFAAIGKAARYGGDLMVTPRARLDEPMFEICLIETFSRFEYLHLLSYAMREGMPRDRKGVRFIKTAKVRAVGDAPVQLDGEIYGHLPMRFEISPHSLEVIVPDQFSGRKGPVPARRRLDSGQVPSYLKIGRLVSSLIFARVS
jgi:diacylglycerol kinase family enzyme